MFGNLFLSALGPQPSILILSTLVFFLLQKFEFALHVRYCCVIWARLSDFNPSFYLQLWIGSVHQSYRAGASLGEELIQRSSLGPGDFILRGLIALKICHIPSCAWAKITKIVHQLKLLLLSKFDDVAKPWLALLRFNYATSSLREVPNRFFSKRCSCFPKGVPIS